MPVSTFLTVVKMSATASITAIFVIILRQLLGRKLPRTFCYVAWTIVLVRLLIPFSIQSDFSLFNIIKAPVTSFDKAMNPAVMEVNNVQQGKAYAEGKAGGDSNDIINETGFNRYDYKNIEDEENERNIAGGENAYMDEDSLAQEPGIISVMSCIWLSVLIILLSFCLYSYLKTSKMLMTAVCYNDNGLVGECCRKLHIKRNIKIYSSKRMETPVVAGIANARIIIPDFLADESHSRELKYVITHELVHIKHYDNITRLFAVLALCIHWFNPLIWLSFLLYRKDMEMSCDSGVLSAYESDIRSEYANSLLNLAIRQNTLLPGGLPAFGESNVKARIKGIMKYKKKGVWLGILAAILLALFGFILLTNGKDTKANPDNSTVIDDKELNKLLEHRSKYIGDASNVSNLLNELPYAGNKQGIELETDGKPYGITIYYRLEDIKASDEETIKNVKSVLQDNALILFSLIENVDTVNYNIKPANLELQFKRSSLQQYFDRKLWEYSGGREEFEEFLADIYFKIHIFPEKYSTVSLIPGMQIYVSLNASFKDNTVSKDCQTENGSLLTWDRKSGEITNHGKSFRSDLGEPVYWSPSDIDESVKENLIKISITNSKGKVIAEKCIRLEKEDAGYSVRPSYDIIFDSYNNSLQGADTD